MDEQLKKAEADVEVAAALVAVASPEQLVGRLQEFDAAIERLSGLKLSLAVCCGAELEACCICKSSVCAIHGIAETHVVDSDEVKHVCCDCVAGVKP